MKTIKQIINSQIEFQDMCGIDVLNLSEQEKLTHGEFFLFKAIEEIIECRKEIPSGLNKFEKRGDEFVRTKMVAEVCDTVNFLINFALVHDIRWPELSDIMEAVQNNNFYKIKTKLLNKLYKEAVEARPEAVIGHYNGRVDALYIFIGQNPAHTINHGEKVFDIKYSDDEKTAGGIIYPVLRELDIIDESYFTNAVKSTTANNSSPSAVEIRDWKPVLQEELKILGYNNPEMKIIPMGRVAQDMTGLIGVPHPGVVNRGTVSRQEYQENLKFFITGGN